MKVMMLNYVLHFMCFQVIEESNREMNHIHLQNPLIWGAMIATHKLRQILELHRFVDSLINSC